MVDFVKEGHVIEVKPRGDGGTTVMNYTIEGVNCDMTLEALLKEGSPLIPLGYKLYYIDIPTYDVDIGGVEYVLKFKEV